MKFEREKKPIKIKLLAFCGTATILGCVIYVLVAGFNLAVLAVGGIALAALSAPGISAGESFVEVISSTFEMVLEGILTVIEVVTEAIGALFNW